MLVGALMGTLGQVIIFTWRKDFRDSRHLLTQITQAQRSGAGCVLYDSSCFPKSVFSLPETPETFEKEIGLEQTLVFRYQNRTFEWIVAVAEKVLSVIPTRRQSKMKGWSWGKEKTDETYFAFRHMSPKSSRT